ncbi:phosphatidate cytidylyltransferase [Geofilum rubicundum]|uniref:Phosphatidate cytidylyltransferase n=1 Tax=Geofilum rubicundum JCM 15548 TaxID=1236989 RepID=A0A0E9LTJ2_9BACT|nr:phosphatidate cytidylyltransferase [Geofilum rubicundum]GAO28618.1 phosphatidate cytidylyltransferase [Geofilum rubicundum JCM 15548]
MIQTIYWIIIGYFLLGALGFFFINRRKPAAEARQSYVKFGVYFLLVNLLFFSMVMTPVWFDWLAGLIVIGGMAELVFVFKRGGYRQKMFFTIALLVYACLALCLLYFSRLEAGLMLFAFLVLSIFDSFSQISGQLFGKRKLAPSVSPNKTMGGFIGGGVTALLSVFWLRQLYGADIWDALALAAGIMFFAFWGDLAASYFKRRYGVKDFSKVLPGHGGLLDRFDSLLAGGAWVALVTYF